MEHDNAEKEHSVRTPVVLYEDADVTCIDKPAGQMVHDDARSTDHTVVDWFIARVPGARGVGEPAHGHDGTPLERSGVVHRLDRETSGVLILAKHQDAFTMLKQQFHDHTIQKEYRTFVYGTMKEKWGTIDRPIGRSAKDFRLRSAQRGAKGALRDAITDWEVIGQNETHAYLRVLPKTGRTHQIRVHLKAIGRPIICDELYAPEQLLQGENLGFTRLALHAYSIAFVLPCGEEKTIIASLPLDFIEAADDLATS
jgi:23S rRNA pseudouridine1911/1915/1917 synthase